MKIEATAVIMAGGKSLRMGFDKQEIKINEKNLVHIQADILGEIFNEVIIISNKPELYKNYHLNVYKDMIKDQGPLGGIHSALVNSSNYYNYFIACDMPNINTEYIKYIYEIIFEDKSKNGIVAKLNDWIEPFNSFYTKNLIESIEIHLKNGKRSVFFFVKKK